MFMLAQAYTWVGLNTPSALDKEILVQPVFKEGNHVVTLPMGKLSLPMLKAAALLMDRTRICGGLQAIHFLGLQVSAI
jgi:hypothetical protein